MKERPEVSHEEEVRLQILSKDIDITEFNAFVENLQRFIRRPRSLAKETGDMDDAILLATANTSVVLELQGMISQFSSRNVFAHIEPEILTQVIFILQRRVADALKLCILAEKSDAAKMSSSQFIAGVISATTMLSIMSAQGAPRKLMVEEWLDEAVGVLRGVAMHYLFPLSDPVYKASKGSKRKKKGRKNTRLPEQPDGDEAEGDSTSDASAELVQEKKSQSSRRTLYKSDEALLKHVYTLLESFGSLFQKELHLPDATVTQCASLCVHSLSVNAIPAFHLHAMRTACIIFSSYPAHRFSILDEVREAASVIPPNRRHLRSYNVAELEINVRSSSALLAQLLCIASTEPGSSQAKSMPKEEASTDGSWSKSRKLRHGRAVKLAMHVVNPLLKRALSEREVEFRTAFQSLFEDILTLYGIPEWPSAELILQTISVSIITRLRTKSEKSVYARTTSVDTLGHLAAKMCQLYGNDVLKEPEQSKSFSIELESLESARESVLVYLKSEGPPHFGHAAAFFEALFLVDDQNIGINLEKRSKRMAGERYENEEDEDEDIIDGQDTTNDSLVGESVLVTVEKNALKRIRNVDNRLSRNEHVKRSDAVQASLYIGKNRSFTAGFRTILQGILEGMNDAAPTVRAKSIKSLSLVDEACEGLLRFIPNVLASVENRCRDVSILTRDAALDLLSRSLLQTGRKSASQMLDSSSALSSRDQISEDPVMIAKVFTVVEKRLCDTATSVRKRAITIMRSILTEALRCSESTRRNAMDGMDALRDVRVHEERIIQVCASIVGRLDDTEASVREAAERTLRLGLFGFDLSQQMEGVDACDQDVVNQLAIRLTAVFTKLPTSIHLSFLSRIVHKALLVKHRPLLAALVNATVEVMHSSEDKFASLTEGRALKDLNITERKQLQVFASRRMACASVICAYGNLEASLVVPHCQGLAPGIKDVKNGSLSEADLICVQRILNVLEIGLGKSTTICQTFLDEVLRDLDVIVCTSPLVILEEAAVRCFCVVVKKTGALRKENPVHRAAETFHGFLTTSLDSIRDYCKRPMPEKLTALERNARVALVRLGLLTRHGDFGPDFIQEVYQTLEAVCHAVAYNARRDTLAKASVRGLSYFLIRHRSYLPSGTQILVSFLERSQSQSDPTTASEEPLSCGDGVRLSIFQGFHELLRDEEERNSIAKPESGVTDEKGMQTNDEFEDLTNENGKIQKKANEKRAEKPILAAEEDAEAGFLALSAQAIIPSVHGAVLSFSVHIRITVANILGLLVRQGLLLPATVVKSLFILLLDTDARCREFASRVVSFLADRHSGMLASASLPALRDCFESSFPIHALNFDCGRDADNGMNIDSLGDNDTTRYENLKPYPIVQNITKMAINDKTGHALLSQAIMVMRRDQRRGVAESLVREFDPRVVLHVEPTPENSNDTRVQEEFPNANVDAERVGEDGSGTVPKNESDDDDDDIGQISGMQMGVTAAESICPLPTLFFLAITISSIDYTNGAGIGGSLTQGGGTASAETKLKYAKEDVTDLVGIATRIISNSGQAVLRVTKQMLKSNTASPEKKSRVALLAARISVLLALKHHLKVKRWEPVADLNEDKFESEAAPGSYRMPSFEPDGKILRYLRGNGEKGLILVDDEANAILELFCKLMREDAIDESDVTVPTRRGGRGRAKGSTTRKSSMKKAARKTTLGVPPSPRRPKLQRRASVTKKLRYTEGSDEEAGSDFDPRIVQ